MGSMPNSVSKLYGRSCREGKQQIDPSGEEPFLALDLLEGNKASGIKTAQVTTIANPTSPIPNLKEEN